MVLAFVGWHLAFLLFRNPVSIFQGDVDDWIDRHEYTGAITSRAVARALGILDDVFTAYEHALAFDQGWRMFVAPLARTAAFPGVEVELDDGSRVQIRSDNEPPDVDGFVLRSSQSRLRKHETQIASLAPEEYGLGGYWERYVVWQCQRWRKAHPNDARRVTRLTLVRRQYELPAPSDAPPTYGEPATEVIGSMKGTACNP